MRFEVESGKNDRFTMTIGPRSTVEGSMPMLAVATVTLVHDGSSKLPAGTFAFVSTGDNSNLYPKPEGGWEAMDPANFTSTERACFRRNLALVQRTLRHPGITASKELVSLETVLRAY
jgi:hypothetical protein